MPRRILSDAYVDRRIAKIDEIFERNQKKILTTPNCLTGEVYSIFGTPRISERERKEISEYYNQFQELSYVRGFWSGWTLREGTRDERDELIKDLMEVARLANMVPEFDHIFDNYPKQFSKKLAKSLKKLEEKGVDLVTQPSQ